MIKKGFIVIVVLLLIGWFVGNSNWHLNRNTRNQLPIGHLKEVAKNLYEDQSGRRWELLPHNKNIFHQPEEESEDVKNPYSNVDKLPPFDTKNPNLKFLYELENGCSYEAILQPDGTYLTTGIKQGTYNYAHPNGLLGSFKHVFLDVIPHFFNDSYK